MPEAPAIASGQTVIFQIKELLHIAQSLLFIFFAAE
jgi:hypothetical protein